MIKSSIEKLAKEIGFDIGVSNDETQADLLNGFCEALHDSIIENYNRDTQICYIAEKLTNKSSLILKRIVDFLEHIKSEKDK